MKAFRHLLLRWCFQGNPSPGIPGKVNSISPRGLALHNNTVDDRPLGEEESRRRGRGMGFLLAAAVSQLQA
ncbi:hypothetical protein EYF80_013025 [Liparis tanakae]|uniref:Uncharacterized protein n=1 Tax=Liparis tanakae TaxID=230148 RepID=A0A4Z2IFN3_9TELE|nr:hypothetical protein EYF80_013025 [Liparis tanakae]